MKTTGVVRRTEILLCLIATGLGNVLAGQTYYVSKSGSDADGDGKSWETAKKTIQAAVGLCATGGGDTIIVDDGDYTDVGLTASIRVDGFAFQIPTVVYIDRPLTLMSRNGKGKTFITGQYGDGTAQDDSVYAFPGTGKGARRCIHSAAPATIKGFTVRKGSTVRAATGVNNTVDIAGGVVADPGNVVYLVDCDVLDCRAGVGAATFRDVRPFRCRFAGNIAKDANHVAYRNSYAFNCLYENNGNGGGYIFTYVQSYRIVNCTFINNRVDAIGRVNNGLKFSAFNCAFLDALATDQANADECEFANCVQAISGGMVAAGTDCETGVTRYQYFSPVEEDWSAVTGNSIVGKGNVAYLTTDLTGAPSVEYLGVDFTGTNPRKTGDSVSVGCFEPTEEKTRSAALVLAGPSAVVAGDRSGPSDMTASNRWFGVSGSGQVRIRYAGTGDMFGYTVSYDGASSYTTSRFPDNGTDGGFWLTPTPDGVTTITAISAADEKWVDADADGEGADGSEENPFKTIPAAMTAVADYGIVRVKPGVYATGTDRGVDHALNADDVACRVSLWKNVAIRSTDGAANTILRGGDDVGTIVRPSNRNRYAQVQGFTLTGGGNDPSRDPSQGETGGAFYVLTSGETSRDFSETIHITDCIITNNVCSERVVSGGWLERCYLCDNFTTTANMNKGSSGFRGTQAHAAILSGCVVTYSPQYFERGGSPTACTTACQNDTLINCTLKIPTTDAIGNAYRTFNTINGYSVAYNDATEGGYFDTLNPAYVVAAGIVSSPGSTDLPWKVAYPAGSFFAAAEAGDYRPIAGCPGILAGASVAPQFVRYETGDFEGRELVCQSNGASIPGAYQYMVRTLLVSCEPGLGTISPSGNRLIDDGESVTFTVSAKSDAHRLIGWMVDGERVETTSLTYTYTADYSKPTFSISPVFSTLDLYVNAAKPDDSGDGMTPETAKKTLAAIVALAVAGDTIHAAAGDYNEGVMTQTAKIAATADYSPSRVVVPTGVSLVADAGPDVTFITGVRSKGPDGVRCVAAFAGATVRGFTLRNGATSASTGGVKDDNLGGCALAPYATSRADTAFFEDCVFSNGDARNGGCVAGGYLYRCKILYGSSGAGASLAFHSFLDSSIAIGDGNTGVRDHHGILSSVVINFGSGSVFRDLAAADDSVCFENSILVCRNRDSDLDSPVHKNVKNCIWNVGQDATKIDDGTCCNVITCAVDMASLVTALESLGLDADFRPARDSVAVDRGDNTLLDGLVDSARDFGGDPRVSNATVDIGACEYDWRPDYAAVLGRRLTVTSCDPAVKLVDGNVRVAGGEGFEVTCPTWKSGVEVQLTVAAVQGSLKIYRNTEITPHLVVTAAGSYRLTAADDGNTSFRFFVDPGGVADLSGLCRLSGLIILLR